ncbi:cupin domain-containing protein [Acidocella aquatica]|nr:cupin domain-containing protein [Acidocella aquatica]
MMIPLMLNAERETLDAWGSPEDIGAVTIVGPIAVSGKILIGGVDKSVFGGLYAATRGIYRVVYGFHEHATLLDGALKMTDEKSGREVIYGPGDSWIIEKDTSMIWEILTPSIRKSYIAIIMN